MTGSIYLQDKQIAARYGVSRCSIWNWLKTDPKFPRPIALSAGCKRWLLSDIETWERDKASRKAA